MKKRLRFQMPHVPLKVLRGEDDQEDVWDKYHERFQAPGTTTEDAEDDKDTDDDSRTSSFLHEYITTDIGEVSEKDMERYLAGHSDSIDSVIQLDNETQNYQNKNSQQNNTTTSVNEETVDVEAVAQVHLLSSRDEPEQDSLSNDDTSPLLTNIHFM